MIGTKVIRETFADNQRVSVAGAIKACAEYRKHQYPISIATGYFNLGGFLSIADALEAAPSVRILIGAEPEYPTVPDILERDREDAGSALERLERTIIAGRDDIAFSLEADVGITRLTSFLKRGSTEVRIYRPRFLHGKAFIFGTEEAVIAGSANFTAAGLNHNLELDLGQYQPPDVVRIAEWFEDLWANAEPFDLTSIFKARLEEYDPHTIYLRMLFAQYSPEVQTTVDSSTLIGTLRLADFQRIGSKRAIRILDEWNGAVLADGVGLGKTMVAGDVIRTFALDRGLRVLVIAPASLRGMWNRYLVQENLPGEVLSYAELAREKRLGVGDGSYLTMDPSQYRLIVADEAHALRNPDINAYKAMVAFLAKSPNAKLLLLTATPVNNSLWDLYHEVMLFAKTDSRFAKVGIPNLREHIKLATKQDPGDLDPAHLFSVLDAISVRRTRRFIKEHFPNAKIGDKVISFPVVTPHAERYDLDAVVPGLFEDVADAVEHRLHMARYRTQSHEYAKTFSEDAARQEFLSGLLRSQMLKRFESSAFAFRKTLEKMTRSHEACLSMIEDSDLVPLRALDEEAMLDEEGYEDLESDGDVAPSSDFEVAKLCEHLRHDIAVLRDLEAKVSKLLPEDDPKLQRLMSLLRDAEASETPDKKKTLVFTTFVDTVQYIKSFLDEVALKDDAIKRLSQRSAFVFGNMLTDADDRAEIACQFAPRSMKPDETDAPDKFDLLVTTDVLAEGQNLQQCGRVVNFDLPWNPMRVVQRNGRVDRIGSPHDTVDVHCFMPDAQLDAILKLEQRLQLKIAHANAGIGLEGVVIPGIAVREHVFTDAELVVSEKTDQILRLAKGDSTVLDELDKDDAYSGESFREELRSALMTDAGQDLEALPWGIGSGHGAGKHYAVVYLARSFGRYFFRRIALADGPMERALLAALSTARCDRNTPRVLPDELRDALYAGWQRARRDIYAWLQDQKDPAKRQGPLPKAQRDAIDLLQRAPSEEAAATAEILATRWPTDVEREIRTILKDANANDASRTQQLCAYVARRGLKAQEPEQVPQVSESDVRLVCYQLVITEQPIKATVSDSIATTP